MTFDKFIKSFVRFWYIFLSLFLASVVITMVLSCFVINKHYESSVKMNYTDGLENNATTANTTIIARAVFTVKGNVYLTELDKYLKANNINNKDAALNLSKSYSKKELFDSIFATYDKSTFSVAITINTKNANDSFIIAKTILEEDMLKLMTSIIDIDGQAAYKNFKVFASPLLNTKPVSPNIIINFFAGVLIGIILGIVGIVVADALDSKIKTPENVKEALDTNILGVIPNFIDEEEIL